MKKRVIISSLIVLSLLMLVSIGFAAWTITNSHEDTENGNFTAYEVSSDGALTVEVVTSAAGTETGSANITFGKNGTPTGTVWLENSGDPENLVAYVKFTVSGLTGNSLALSVTHNFRVSNANYTLGTTGDVPENTLISGPTIAVASGSVASYSNGVLTFTGDGSVVLSFTYSWGSAFGGANPQNPYVYYNNQTKTDALVADATAKLAALKTLCDKLSFQVVVADNA